MPTQAVNDRELIEVICTPMTETARAETLGIPRPTYYRHLSRLCRAGILRPRGYLDPNMRLRGSHPRSRYSGTHHAPVQHIRWIDSYGKWAIQGSLLDKWEGEDTNNASVTLRWQSIADYISTSFEVYPVNRWSIRDTYIHLPVYAPWDQLSYDTLRKITIAIAKIIDAEALLIPEDLSEGHFKCVE